jgi:4-amino-4-deoxy-L-arabinose transferase-like glycosyltransferase
MRQTRQKESTPYVVIITAGALFILFFSYYVFTAWHLPRGAGPDSGAHYDVAKFIYENGRLAVVPEDVDRLALTPYGSTRALRPPLSYLVSAGVAGAVGAAGSSTFVNLRFGSGLLCAFAVLLSFIGLWLLFERYWLALAGSLLFGLLPQLAFIASYTNDDSGAIFSATALVFAMILVLRKGLSGRSSIVFGISAGLVLLSKFTAWLLLPLAAGFLVPYLWRSRRFGANYMAAIAVAVVVGGGWWILFNIYHYGIDDPVLAQVSTRLSEQRAVLQDAGNRGYVSRGVGLSELILHNYKNFIGETFKATVGHLDWLRIRLGWPQYALYALIFGIGFIYLPFRLVREWIGTSSRYDPHEAGGTTWFYCTLFLMTVFQIIMYIRFNLYHDVQVQGKYLLPAFFPVLILFSAALVEFGDGIAGRVRNSASASKIVLGVLCFAIIIGSHIHGLRAYVVPYYFPQPLVFRMSTFHYVDLTNLKFVKASQDVRLRTGPEGLTAESLGIDPQIRLKDKLCKRVTVNSIIHVVLHAEKKGDLKIYIDEGKGFSESNVQGRRYGPGENHIIIPMGFARCRAIRLDPASEPGTVVIERVGIASLHIANR